MALLSRISGYRLPAWALLVGALLLSACSTTVGKRSSAVISSATSVEVQAQPGPEAPTGAGTPVEIADLTRIPQRFAELARAAGDRLSIGDACRARLQAEFQRNFFAPWSSTVPLFDVADSKLVMTREGRHDWWGVNKRKVPKKFMRGLLENCDLARFPSRNDAAIAVAPGHLRGLPTLLPLYDQAEDEPFDMLSYPQLTLNEPLRVLHVSRDGVWLFVESGTSTGWIETRDVALVDQAFIDSWMQAPHLVLVRDFTPVADGRGIGVYRSKIGTILPLKRAGEGWWEVAVASAGEGGRAESATSRIAGDAAAPFPLAFNKDGIALIGDQLLGQPYGWGEIYGLRDCSAMLRDFFLPFGIWLPRTSADQVDSVSRRLYLGALAPPEKKALLLKQALPFLTLVYKPGHIMLYLGVDGEGRPLVFHDAWSIKVRDGEKGKTQIIGLAAITTLEPGKELGLVPGSSLLERSTELATITRRCDEPSP